MFPEAEAAIDHRAIEENMRGLQFMTGDSTPAMPAATTPLLKMSALEVPSSPAAAPGRRGPAAAGGLPCSPPAAGGPLVSGACRPPAAPSASRALGGPCCCGGPRAERSRGPARIEPGGPGPSQSASGSQMVLHDIYIYIYIYI